MAGRSPYTGDDHPGSHERKLSLPSELDWHTLRHSGPVRAGPVAPRYRLPVLPFMDGAFHIGGFTIPLDSL